MPRPPPRFSSRASNPTLLLEVGRESGESLHGEFERRHLEDLRADVSVQADEVAPGDLHRPLDGLGRDPVLEAEPELRVLLAGLHELVGVRLDSGRDPHEELGGYPGLAEAIDLFERVHHDTSDADLCRLLQLGERLVVAVEDDPLGWKAGGQTCRQLSPAADIEAETRLFKSSKIATQLKDLAA